MVELLHQSDLASDLSLTSRITSGSTVSQDLHWANNISSTTTCNSMQINRHARTCQDMPEIKYKSSKTTFIPTKYSSLCYAVNTYARANQCLTYLDSNLFTSRLVPSLVHFAEGSAAQILAKLIHITCVPEPLDPRQYSLRLLHDVHQAVCSDYRSYWWPSVSRWSTFITIGYLLVVLLGLINLFHGYVRGFRLIRVIW